MQNAASDPRTSPRGVRIRTRATCAECGRTFDLLSPTDAEEWAFGHDCEAPARIVPLSERPDPFAESVYGMPRAEWDRLQGKA